jgi:hypothetical protein
MYGPILTCRGSNQTTNRKENKHWGKNIKKKNPEKINTAVMVQNVPVNQPMTVTTEK